MNLSVTCVQLMIFLLLSSLTHFSLEIHWDVTVNQREDDSKTHREGLSETECELDAT